RFGSVQGVTNNMPTFTFAIFTNSSPGQSHTVCSGRLAHGSFHRNTSKIKVSAKFHYPIRDRKRKKEPESTSCIALITRFNHASYLNLSLHSVLLLDSTNNGIQDVLE